jgi:carboxyl-terminal processing protease
LLRDENELEIEITRKQIMVSSVETEFKSKNGNNYAHVRVNQFGDNTNKEWDKTISDIEKRFKNGSVSGIILDLRGNPGGYLESAVYLASEFIQNDKLIVKQETSNEQDTLYKVRRNGKLLDIPLVVLINEGSASASEILSGALRDYKRATLIGQKSFGKGSVQEALELQGGAGLHVTVAKWILPNGDWINGVGITPEIIIENKTDENNSLTDETDAQLQKALEVISTK